MKIDKENFMKYIKKMSTQKRLTGIGNYTSCLLLVTKPIELKQEQPMDSEFMKQ